MSMFMRLSPVFSPDEGNPAPSGESSTPPAQQFAPPPGQRLVSDEDYGRYESSYKTIESLGFKNPKELENYKGFFEAHRKAGTDIGMLTGILNPQQQKKSQAEPLTLDAIGRLMDERRNKELSESAEREHDEYMQRMPSMYESALADVFKDKDDDIDPILKEIAESRLLKARMESAYPEGHPLHGKRLGRVEEAKIKEIASALAENRKMLNAWKLKSIGKAANQPTKPTAAGVQGGGGAPDKDAADAEATRDMRIEMARQAREKAMASAR